MNPHGHSKIHEGHSRKFGFRFTYYEDDSYVAGEILHDNYEPVESALFDAVLRPSSVVLDVGANLGFYSMIAARKNVPVLAVEPHSGNFNLLQFNLELNDFDTVLTYPYALGASEADMPLYLCKRNGVVLNHGDHRLWQADAAEVDVELVHVTTGDELLAVADLTPTIVKLDTQGYEYFIMQGLKGLLGSGVPLLLFTEFSAESYKTLGVAPEDYFALLQEQFEHIFLLDDATRKAIPARSLEQLEQYRKFRGHTHVNLFCTRGSASLGCEIPASQFNIK